jgi:NADH:ubiquinone reductase (H+-translocating)
VTGVVPEVREIRTGDGRVLRYDRLVYAAGSRTASPGPRPADPVPAGPISADLVSAGPVFAGPVSAGPVSAGPVSAGPVSAGPVSAGPVSAGPVSASPVSAGQISADPASPARVFTPESAAELHKRLLHGPGSLAVVGGGLTGIELAAEIAEAEPAVGLITAGLVGPGLSGPGRDHVRRVLGARGVRLDEGHRITGPADIDADVVVWAASMAARTELAAAAGLALTGGRIAVGPALRSVSDPGIYVAGDAAASVSPAAGQLRMACATALPTGSHAAGAVLDDLRGEEPAPLRYRFFLQCISLGRRDGLVQLVHADDSPRRRIITGRAAATAKEQVVRSTVRTLRLAVRHLGAARHVLGMS